MSFIRAVCFALFILFGSVVDFGDRRLGRIVPLQAVADTNREERAAPNYPDTTSSGITSFKSTVDAIKTALPDSEFDIVMPPIVSQPERLTSRMVYSKNIPERNSVAGPFADYKDFKNRGVSLTSVEVLSHGIKGCPDVFIETPLSYAEQLSATDKSENPFHIKNLTGRLTLAELPRLIDELPDSSYFNHVLLSDKPNPEDDWSTQTYLATGFVSITAMFRDGRLMLYKMKSTDPYVRTDFIHEWSHALRYKYEDDRLMRAFDRAVEFERDWSPNRYANRSATEFFAVLGERLLSTNSSEFLESCRRAPIKTTLWCLILKKALLRAPLAHRSVNHAQYLKRVEYVIGKVKPNAQANAKMLEGDQAQVIQQALSSTE